jgi:hypothetical protein
VSVEWEHEKEDVRERWTAKVNGKTCVIRRIGTYRVTFFEGLIDDRIVIRRSRSEFVAKREIVEMAMKQ